MSSSDTPDTTLSPQLQQAIDTSGLAADSLELADYLDQQDPLHPLRSHYHLPLKVSAQHSSWPTSQPAPAPSSSEPALYLCGNSLGPLPKLTKTLLQEEIDAWGTHSVLGHFNHPHGSDRQWTKMDDRVNWIMSDIVGAKPCEVVAMNTLTANLHTVLQTFYRPLARPDGMLEEEEDDQTSLLSGPRGLRKHKIIHEASPFPSDQYALNSAVRLNNLDPDTSLVPLIPRMGEDSLRTEDILEVMEQQAETGECWGILLGGLQYLTGQFFELEKITKRGKELGLIVGLDLAHAFANVPLRLHDWGVDFAVWCTYKYGSSGPGGIAGLYIHEDWSTRTGDKALTRPAGWWGHKKSTRFAMPPIFDPIMGAHGWQVSNPSMLDMAALRGSLETLRLAIKYSSADSEEDTAFATSSWADEQDRKTTSLGAGKIMPILRSKSLRLTSYLEYLLFTAPQHRPIFSKAGLKLVTPKDENQRGSQLSIRIPNATSSLSASADPNLPTSPSASNTTSKVNQDGPSVPPPLSQTTLVAQLQSYAEENFGLIADIRNPDILRLAPLAQYSTFRDCWEAVEALSKSIEVVLMSKSE